MNNRSFPLFTRMAGILLFLAASGAAANANERPQVIISVEVAAQGADQVAITYAAPVTADRVRSDVVSLSRSTGWVVNGLQVSPSDNLSGGERFSAQFNTLGAVDPGTGTLPVAPLISAFRAYPHILLLFDLDTPFTYIGSQSYSDANVDLHLIPQTAGSRTFAFHVDVKNPAQLELNGAGLGGKAIDTTPTPGAPLTRILMAFVAASLVGFSAYILLVRFMLRSRASGGSEPAV